MGKTYLQGDVLTAADLNDSLTEAVKIVETRAFTTTGTIDSTSTITGDTVVDKLGNVRKVPKDSKTNNYTIQSADSGKLIYATGAINMPSGIFSPGDNVTIYNSTGSTITIYQTGGTMLLAGFGTSGNRTLDTKGLATLVCVDTNVYVITGAGLS